MRVSNVFNKLVFQPFHEFMHIIAKANNSTLKAGFQLDGNEVVQLHRFLTEHLAHTFPEALCENMEHGIDYLRRIEDENLLPMQGSITFRELQKEQRLM
jgi:hypothetical protein